MIQALLRRSLVRQFIKYSLVGVLNTMVDFGVYISLTRFAGLHFLLANAVSFLVAVTLSFWLNRRWTFRDRIGDRRRQYMFFFLINLIALGLNEALLASFVHFFDVHDLLAKAAATVVVLFWNFFANRAWTFRATPAVRLPVTESQDIINR
jgi:putative flippase GtrA